MVTKKRNRCLSLYTIQLVYASKVRIKRHIKIKGAVNPYDPQWELYLEERRSRKMADSLRDRANLLTLWKEQDGTCPVCSQKITYETIWHDHHIVWRSEGGGDNLTNRVLVHPDCQMPPCYPATAHMRLGCPVCGFAARLFRRVVGVG